MGIQLFQYDGKRALVVGGATGMGAAVARLVTNLGGEVTVFDIADVNFPVAASAPVDLRDRNSVDEALASLDHRIDALFMCAGVADGTPGLMVINFIAQRHIVDSLVTSGVLAAGSSISMISSLASLGWQVRLLQIQEFLATPDWESAVEWIAGHEGVDNYRFSKRAINAYVAQRALELVTAGIRINAVDPSLTDTPLSRANEDTWFKFGADYRAETGLDPLLPEQLAYPLAFLCSDAASGITGTSIPVEQGLVGSAITGTFKAPGITERLR
jgi:NAD(P)-dependent dehydrogenase (short-subunit alcohol dehydrogenase family)